MRAGGWLHRELLLAMLAFATSAACSPVHHHFLQQDHERDPALDWSTRIAVLREEVTQGLSLSQALSQDRVLEVAAMILDRDDPGIGAMPAGVEDLKRHARVLDGQLALEPGELLLALEVDRADPPLVVALTRECVRVVQIEVLSSARLQESLANLLDGVSGFVFPKRDWRRHPDLIEVSALILGPLSDLLDATTRVLVCQDDPLGRFPIGTLLVTREDRPEFLIEEHEIRVVHHFDTLWSSRAVPTPGFDVGVATASDAFGQLRALQGEMDLIRTIFPNVRSFDMSRGTPEGFSEWSRDLQVLHVGGHAQVVEGQELEGVALLRGADSAPEVFVGARSVRNLGISVPLVFLSACSAGASPGGDGSLSLATGFLDAGCESVVAPLWAVGDVPASILVREFYRYYGPLDAAGALKRAVGTLLAHPMFSHPHFWSGYYVVQSQRAP